MSAAAPSDDGYSSDSSSASCESLADAVYAVEKENGREYAAYYSAQYHLPIDRREQEREERIHHFLKKRCHDKLHYAPVGNPSRILDIGTGTGRWAIEMGDMYPGAHILGVDLVPIQPSLVPVNVEFRTDNIEGDADWSQQYFQYIHCRHLAMAMQNWEAFLRRSFSHLSPGGWLEIQDIDYDPQSAKPGVETSRFKRFWIFVTRGFKKLHVDLDMMTANRMVEVMTRAGFVNVNMETLSIPVGGWPDDETEAAIGREWNQIILDGLQAVALRPLSRGLRWSRARTEMEQFMVRAADNDASTEAMEFSMRLYTITGQKPPSFS